ncbi:MAG TPA: hypothetical protein VJN18_28855 [Polyangiaceae bacterium]|nr:hypothetical protein [Polyangiaceae bacterium]
MVLIAPRFCGPPDSGNGGYSAGLLANLVDGATEVTLRSPPPLGRELAVVDQGDQLELRDGHQLIAEARSTTLSLDTPACPSFERASELSRYYIGHKVHQFPSCFVCGPARAPGDGLRIFPGSERLGDSVAAPWIPDGNLTSEGGSVRPEYVWAALDCAGYFASAAPDFPVALLGRMTAAVLGSVAPGEGCVVIGWPLGRDGRKLYAGTAVFGEGAKLCAIARQTWILVGSGNPSRRLFESRPPPSTRAQ